MSTPPPIVGVWYETLDGETLEVVAYDSDEDTIEVQFFDGTVDEYDQESWEELGPIVTDPPEDWSGSLDLSKEDYGVDLGRPAGDTHENPLDKLEEED